MAIVLWERSAISSPRADLPEQLEPLPLTAAVHEGGGVVEVKAESLHVRWTSLRVEGRGFLGHHSEPPGHAEQSDPGLGGELIAFEDAVEPGRLVAHEPPVVHGFCGRGELDPGGGPSVPAGRIELVTGGPVVVGEDGRTLVEPVGVDALD